MSRRQTLPPLPPSILSDGSPTWSGRRSVSTRQQYATPNIQLTQADILSSLKKLSHISHNDVRDEIIIGIYE